MKKYDVIGDIHGHAGSLKALLVKLGYQVRDGVYRHPERMVLFLGDFIDRGPAIRETLSIVKAMCDAGSALAIMGNHEWNALAYHTSDGMGDFLRAHSSKNRDQHQATLEQVAEPHPEEWAAYLEWFAALPLYLDLGSVRAVHAVWNDEAIRWLQTDGTKTLAATALAESCDPDSPRFHHMELLLKGMEIPLPEGEFYLDKGGFPRTMIRTKWWLDFEDRSYSGIVFPDSDSVPLLSLPKEIWLDASGKKKHQPYPADAPPVFFGHYWLPRDENLSPQTANVACLDYSVAKRGPLVAYRWSGEQTLDPGNFVSSHDS